MERKSSKESDLYPIIEKWLKKRHRCFATSINTGLRVSRPDVTGVCDIGGDLSGEVDVYIIEVKKGTQPYATACGQTLGYKIFANKVYLADCRENAYTNDEIHIASHLGIGLVLIRGTKCYKILSSPHYTPITKFNLHLLETMALGYCQICGYLFSIGNKDNRFKNLSRENLAKAHENHKGLIFWNREVSARKEKLGIRITSNGSTYERRFICPDCINNFFPQS